MNASKNATVTRVRAVYGKRLMEKDYNELCTRKRVAEAAEYLKRSTYYGDAFNGIDTSSIHRGHLESLLQKAFYDRYEKLCDFQQLSGEPFYNFLLIRTEIRELLKAILYLNNEKEDVYIETLPAFFVKKATFDLIELAKAKSFKEMLGVVRNTPYYSILSGIETDKNGMVPYTVCEVALRSYYMSWLNNTAREQFRGSGRDELIRLINVQTDIINIINAYRMKKYFGWDGERIKKHSLPFYGRISRKKQADLFESADTDEYIRTLKTTVYGRQMDGLYEGMESSRFEAELYRLQCRMAKRALRFSDSAAVSLYAFMHLCEVEVNNIVTIIECIRYEKSIPYMQELLVIS